MTRPADPGDPRQVARRIHEANGRFRRLSKGVEKQSEIRNARDVWPNSKEAEANPTTVSPIGTRTHQPVAVKAGKTTGQFVESQTKIQGSVVRL